MEAPIHPSDAICRVCGIKLTVHQGFKGICDAIECRRQDVGFQEQIREEHVRDRARAIALDKLGVGAPVTLVPFDGSDLVHLSDERRSEFLEHLRSVIQDAQQHRANGQPGRTEQGTFDYQITPQQAELPILGAACGACGGVCCHTGGTEAWFEPASFDRLLEKHAPFRQMTVDEIIDVYSAYLPVETYERSCVYHAAKGCSLPREIRSNVCYEYLCKGLLSLISNLAKPEAETVVASVVGTTVMRIGHFTVDEVKRSEDVLLDETDSS